MSKSLDLSKIGASPGKLALIAVLAVVLIVVLFVQFGGGFGTKQSLNREPDGESHRSEPDGETGAQSDRPSRARGTSRDSLSPWPKLDLADVLDYNPFAVRAPVSEPSDSPATTVESDAGRAEQERLLQQLQQEGVQAVIGSAVKGNAAVIGSRTVRVGDVLGQLRVVAVESDGVVLEPQTIE